MRDTACHTVASATSAAHTPSVQFVFGIFQFILYTTVLLHCIVHIHKHVLANNSSTHIKCQHQLFISISYISLTHILPISLSLLSFLFSLSLYPSSLLISFWISVKKSIAIPQKYFFKLNSLFSSWLRINFQFLKKMLNILKTIRSEENGRLLC